jgi:hypothetical protein
MKKSEKEKAKQKQIRWKKLAYFFAEEFWYLLSFVQVDHSCWGCYRNSFGRADLHLWWFSACRLVFLTGNQEFWEWLEIPSIGCRWPWEGRLKWKVRLPKEMPKHLSRQDQLFSEWGWSHSCWWQLRVDEWYPPPRFMLPSAPKFTTWAFQSHSQLSFCIHIN